jgi:hypothetical protein
MSGPMTRSQRRCLDSRIRRYKVTMWFLRLALRLRSRPVLWIAYLVAPPEERVRLRPIVYMTGEEGS